MTTRSKRNYGWAKRTFGDGCVYCGSYATDVEHLFPFIAGGDNSRDNLAVACKVCNGIAGSGVFRTFGEKLAYVRERRKQLGYDIPAERYKADIPEQRDKSPESAVNRIKPETVSENLDMLDQIRRFCGKRTMAGRKCTHELSVLNGAKCPIHG